MAIADPFEYMDLDEIGHYERDQGITPNEPSEGPTYRFHHYAIYGDYRTDNLCDLCGQ